MCLLRLLRLLLLCVYVCLSLSLTHSTRGVRLGTWYPHKSTLEVFSFLRFAFAKGNEILMLPSLKSNHDYLNHPIKPIR